MISPWSNPIANFDLRWTTYDIVNIGQCRRGDCSVSSVRDWDHGLRCDWYDIARPDNRIPDRCHGRSTDRFSEGKGRDRGDPSQVLDLARPTRDVSRRSVRHPSGARKGGRTAADDSACRDRCRAPAGSGSISKCLTGTRRAAFTTGSASSISASGCATAAMRLRSAALLPRICSTGIDPGRLPRPAWHSPTA
jgi:hypothetical protein